MGKGEEYLARKRNKAARKRLSSRTVDFTRGVQAAKRRRKAGRRRLCEGMCYSLPTPDDPFNELYQEKLTKKKARKLQTDATGCNRHVEPTVRPSANGSFECGEQKQGHGRGVRNSLSAKADHRRAASKIKSGISRENFRLKSHEPSDHLENGIVKGGTVCLSENLTAKKGLANGDTEKVVWHPTTERCVKKDGAWTAEGGDCFEACLCAFLNAGLIEDSTLVKYDAKSRKHLIARMCDWQFWEACGSGTDVLATGRAGCTNYRRDYVVAALAHITMKRFCSNIYGTPVVLFLLQSQEDTLQVKKLCKPLKTSFGVCSVGLHTGTSIERQIKGLRVYKPKVLIATPERLCELLAVKAVSISNVSFMVVDELLDYGFEEHLQKITSLVATNVQITVFNERVSHAASTICRQVLRDPIARVISHASLVECSSCITQDVFVFISEEKRLQKLIFVLRQHFERQEDGTSFKGVVVLVRQSQVLLHAKTALEAEGYSVGSLDGDIVESEQISLTLKQFRQGQVEVLLTIEAYVGVIDVTLLGMIINYEFPSSISAYCRVLMAMARHTVDGMLLSFCTGATAPLASELVDVLQESLQPVPPSLVMLADAAKAVEKHA